MNSRRGANVNFEIMLDFLYLFISLHERYCVILGGSRILKRGMKTVWYIIAYNATHISPGKKRNKYARDLGLYYSGKD